LQLITSLLLLALALFGGIMVWTNWQRDVNAAAPSIDFVEPNVGSTLGGTAVLIDGHELNANMKAVALGGEFTCGISNGDGKVYCWGRNDYGQLGDGTTTDRLVPTPVNTSGALNGLTVQSVTAGLYHACAIASDTAYCWGRNDFGQLGNGATTDSTVPVKVLSDGHSILSGQDISAISASNNSTCVIASSLNVFCWGAGGLGQLGDGLSTDSPMPVAATLTLGVNLTASAISGGGEHFCAIADGGPVACWGDGTYGQLGDGNSSDSNIAVWVDTSGALSGLGVQLVAAGGNHTCAIASDQKAYCWGRNDSGQLGNNTTTDSAVPVAVSPSDEGSVSTYINISAGYNYTCGDVNIHYSYCWGDNSSWQLRQDNPNNSLVPISIGYPLSSAVASHSDGVLAQHTCGFVDAYNHIISCWGAGGYNSAARGQLGTGLASGAGPSERYDMSVVTWVNSVSLGGADCIAPDARSVAMSIYYTSTWIYCTTTAHAAGKVDALVTLVTGEQLNITGAFTYVVPPPAPINLTAVQHSSDSIMLDWTAPETGNVSCYFMQYKLSSSSNWADVPAAGASENCEIYHNMGDSTYGVDAAFTSFAVSGLSSGQSYDFRVAAYDDQTTVTGPYSNVASAIIINPSITSITPDHGIVDGGTAVTINGSGFSGTAPRVTLDGLACTNIVLVDSTTITCNTPAHAAGPVDVVVDNGQTATLPAGYTYEDIYVAVTADEISFGVLPGRFSSGVGSAAVTTNNPTGFQLSLSADSSGTSLKSGANSIASLSGYNASSPASAATINGMIGNSSFWGYRISGFAGFDIGATPANNVAATSYKWATIPTFGAATEIKSQTTPTDNGLTNPPATVDVMFGAGAAPNQLAGKYQATLLYTVSTLP
jgi:alpha-tubulin suppressor-like RCC1 family protein